MVEKTNVCLCLIKIYFHFLSCFVRFFVSLFAKYTFPLVRGTFPKLTFLDLLKIITVTVKLNIVKLAETLNYTIN